MTAALPTESPTVTGSLRAETAKPAGSRKVRIRLTQVLLIAGILIAWELLSGTVIDDLLISKPSEILPQFWTWVVDGELLYNASSTFRDAAAGLFVGGLAGLTVGCLLGRSPYLAEIFEPFITALYTMPKHALIPLFIMWVGIGSQLRIVTAATIVFFLVFYNTFFGIRDVSQALVDSVKVMGGSSADVLFRVSLPSAMVWVIAAMKLAVPQAIVGVVVAEMLAGDRGLGYLVALNAGMFNSQGTFAAIFALLIAGFLVDRLVGFATRPAMKWKATPT